MARTLAELPAGSRITDSISLGVMVQFCPAARIHEVRAQTQRTSVRERDLPAQGVVYYVIALALYMRSSYPLRPRQRARTRRIEFAKRIRIVK